jgi:hypothetical protein
VCGFPHTFFTGKESFFSNAFTFPAAFDMITAKNGRIGADDENHKRM